MLFEEDVLRFSVFYPNPELLDLMRASDGMEPPQKVRSIMGDVVFPGAPADRPYLYGCMVLSFDGKMGFTDNPEGHLISATNTFDSVGAVTDFWIMNVCRTYADGVILGAGTLWARIDKPWSAQIVDKDLVVSRSGLGKRTEQPLSLVATFDGEDVPLRHAILDMKPCPALLTSNKGAAFLAAHLGRSCAIFGTPCDLFCDDGVIKIIAAGEDEPDTAALMRILRQSGMNYVSIEAPGYIWHLIQTGILDEYMLNYSGVMVGGEYIIGSKKPFSTGNHPHAALLSAGYHRGFIYTRQKLIYDGAKQAAVEGTSEE